MAAQTPGATAAAPGDQSQAAQTPGGQPDYTKAWEEYYKKMGMSKWELLKHSFVRMYLGKLWITSCLLKWTKHQHNDIPVS